MASSRNKTKKKSGGGFHLNLGLVIFLIILFYVLYSLFRYATSKQVVGYEVRIGSLQSNRIYSAVALRSEEIAKAEYAGYVNYYTKEGERIGADKLACTIDTSGEVAEALQSGTASGFTSNDYSDLQADITEFASAYTPGSFSSVYSFKDSLNSTIQKITNSAILGDIKNIADSASIHYCNTDTTGYIVYSTDGYEGKTFDTLAKSDFDTTNYKKTSVENNALVSVGDPIYRLETAEDWSLAILLSGADEAKELEDLAVMQVKFLKNQLTCWATITTRQDDSGNYYANLAFTNSMCTFCTDRFLDIELLTDNTKGLKIPLTSLVDGEFFVVPQEYVTAGTGGQDMVLRQTVTESGDTTTETVSVTPYGTDESGNYYLDQSSLRDGDILVKQDSQSTFTVHDTAKLTGVYNINKGYADFRQVTVIDQNDEYAIVEPDDTYGLREYDFIVLDASTMSPDEFVYQ